MNTTYFEVDVEFQIESEGKKGNMQIKRKKSKYLVKTPSTYDAETRIAEYLKESSFVYEILCVKKSKVVEIIE